MLHLLPDPIPWYIVGPLMGFIVAGMYAVANKHLGVSGAYVQIVTLTRRRPIEVWRLWFLGGIFLGGAAVAILGESPQAGLRYGRLTDLLPLGMVIPIIFVGGVLIGYGARWMGACTSGHGLSGCSTRSPGSMVATTVLYSSAVGATLLLHVLTRGAL